LNYNPQNASFAESPIARVLFPDLFLRVRTGCGFRSTSATEKPRCQEASFSLVASLGKS